MFRVLLQATIGLLEKCYTPRLFGVRLQETLEVGVWPGGAPGVWSMATQAALEVWGRAVGIARFGAQLQGTPRV